MKAMDFCDNSQPLQHMSMPHPKDINNSSLVSEAVIMLSINMQLKNKTKQKKTLGLNGQGKEVC